MNLVYKVGFWKPVMSQHLNNDYCPICLSIFGNWSVSNCFCCKIKCHNKCLANFRLACNGGCPSCHGVRYHPIKNSCLYNTFSNDWSNEWFQFILENPDKDWNYKFMSLNPNLTFEIVQANPDKDWDYEYLIQNPNISISQIIHAYPDKPWHFIYMTRYEIHPPYYYGVDEDGMYFKLQTNIDWEVVKSYPDDPWNYEHLSQNPMYEAKDDYIRKKFQEWFKRSTLKEELMAKLWHPNNFEKFKYYDPETFGEDF